MDGNFLTIETHSEATPSKVAAQPNGSGEVCADSNCTLLVFDNGIYCDVCNSCYHQSCTELDKQAYDFLSSTKFQSILWKCANCPSVAMKENVVKNQANIEVNPENKVDKNTSTTASYINTDSNMAVHVNENRTEYFLPGISTTAATNSSKENNFLSSPKQICLYYKKGRCRHGVSGKKVVLDMECKFLNPRKCMKFCKFGRDKYRGCSGTCGLFHPIICKYSINFKRCSQPNCTFAHLLGTRRNDNYMAQDVGREMYQSSNLPVATSYYQKTRGHMAQRGDSAANDSIGKSNGLAYKHSDFPPLKNQQQENMEEITAAIKQMQMQMQKQTQQIDHLMKSSISRNHDEMGNNHQPSYPNGYQLPRFNEAIQHPTLNNPQMYNVEAKNY